MRLFLFIFITCIVLFLASSANAASVIVPVDVGCDDTYFFDQFKSMIEQFQIALNTHFPFSLLAVAIGYLQQISLLSPESPASFEMCTFGFCIQPLGFLDSGVFDVLFAGMRVLIVLLMLFSIARYVMEYVL